MRPIKFRAWSAKRKEMTGGMPLPMLAGWITGKYPNLDDEIYLQFTGLHDKNGKEIYEGDFLKWTLPKGYAHPKTGQTISRDITSVGLVFYYGSCFGLRTTELPEEEAMEYDCPVSGDIHRNEYGEVIGNIHENPDLIKGA